MLPSIFSIFPPKFSPCSLPATQGGKVGGKGGESKGRFDTPMEGKIKLTGNLLYYTLLVSYTCPGCSPPPCYAGRETGNKGPMPLCTHRRWVIGDLSAPVFSAFGVAEGIVDLGKSHSVRGGPIKRGLNYDLGSVAMSSRVFSTIPITGTTIKNQLK